MCTGLDKSTESSVGHLCKLGYPSKTINCARQIDELTALILKKTFCRRQISLELR